MFENSPNANENEAPPAFVMWKMFHSTITALFKNLDTAENNLEALANTVLSSKECSDIFIPRYDSSLTFEQNQIIENKYKDFTIWILGRLFYLLSCEKLERIHDLFVQAQQKILIVLRLNQPHNYNILITEYNKVLTTINCYLKNNSFSSLENYQNNIFINNFIVNDVGNSVDLDLSPIFVQIQSENQCYILQQKLLKILIDACLIYVDDFWLDVTTESILNNIVYCLQNSKTYTKIILIEYFSELLQKNYFQMKKSPVLMKHFLEIFDILEQIIVNNKTTNVLINSKDCQRFYDILSRFFNVVIDINVFADNNFAREKLRYICYVLLLVKLKGDSSINENYILMKSCMSLTKNILQYEGGLYANIEILIDYIINSNSCNDFEILLQYQILEEIKLNINLIETTNVLEMSSSFRRIFDAITTQLDQIISEKVPIELIYKSLVFLNSVVNSAQKIYFSYRQWCLVENDKNIFKQITFFNIQELLIKIRKIINIYSINTSVETQGCLDLIVEIFACLITFSYKSQELIYMIDLICYPFYNIQDITLHVNNLITNDFNEHIMFRKRMKCVQFLSVCLINLSTSDQKLMLDSTNKILLIFKYVVNSNNNSNLTLQVAKYLINLVGTLRNHSKSLYEILKQLIFINNPQVLNILSENLGKIICVLSGNFTISPLIKEKDIKFEILCLQCDFYKMQENDQKLYRKSNKECLNISQIVVQPNIVRTENLSMIINLLNSTEYNVKLNVVRQLPRLVKHLPGFNTIPVTTKWLNFIGDQDRNIRTIFVTVVKSVITNCQNNESLSQKYKQAMLSACLKTLINLTQKYLRSGNADILETLLDTIKEFGCLKNEDVIYTTSKLIIFYLILCNTYLSLTAIDHLNRIAKSHGMTPNFIFTKYKTNFCQAVANMSVYGFCIMECTVVQSLERIALAFGFTLKEFLSRNAHHLLPYFIPSFIRVPESAKILNDIANLMIVEQSDLITTNFAYIYTHIYLNEDVQIFEKCMQFIEKLTKSYISSLKKRNIKVLYNELLLHVHYKRDLVLKELYKLSLEESDSNLDSSSKSNSDILQQVSDYLQPRFLGVLVYFDSKLISKSADDSLKTRVLESLPEIIKIMGTKYITPLRHKVLSTLRTAVSLTEKNYLELTCNIWESFVQCCEIDSLGPLLSTIFVSMLPLLELFPRKINSIFKYLVIENNEKLKNHIQDLFFLSETKVDFEIKTVIKTSILKNQGKSFKEHLEMYLKYINHENLEVRVYGLKFLKKYLETKYTELEQIILGNNGMEPVLVEIIDVLIAGCRENDQQVRLVCAECIGELGAIEPSHFPRKYTQSDSSFTFFITDDSFVVNALMELLKSFQMEKQTQNMNRFALAIQEILKAYDVSPDENASKNNLWSSFPKNMQELMLPLLSSRYTVAGQSSEKKINHPIYGPHLEFSEWIYKWTSHLISLLQNDKKPLLQVCKPILKIDYRTLMIFLPHILIHALLESSEAEKNLIYEEFMAVLNNMQQEKKPSKTDDCNKNNCIKVIFILLDYLDRWLREYEVTKCPKKLDVKSDSNYKKIHNFVALFCKLKIASCNFLRGEYPRALMYLEHYVLRDKNKIKQQLGFFSKIYAELEEPDAVAGAMALQETEPSLEDMILAHNVSGQLQDAGACYERMAQERILEPQYLQDMVRCYLEIDNPFTALNITRGIMEKYSECKTLLYESQAEPLWRLSLYEELSDLLEKTEMKNNHSWGVRMGQALVHFRNGNRIEFSNELDNVRKILIDKLNITSLEEGVYRHGYPHIIKLQILNELQKAEELVYKIKNISDTLACEQAINDLIDEWNIRLKIVQSSARVVEPILRLRRIILEQSQHVLGSQISTVKSTLDKHISKYWLKSAELARRAAIIQQSYVYILKAEKYKSMELFIEKAKLFWAKEEHELAFNTLKRGIEEFFPDSASFKDMDASLRKQERKLCAEAKLLIATYNDETSNVFVDVNIINYKEAVDMYREWEKSHVCLAQYYDRVYSTMSDDDPRSGDIQIHIINSFGKSLQYGSTYIYQSMPRMLSIWFDYGTRYLESRPRDSQDVIESKKNTLLRMIKIMDAYLDRLPAYMFLSAFSQLVSRICHPVREVYIQIKSILIKLILKYPQQSMWMIMAVSKSAYAMRTKRCQEVLQDHRLKNSHVMKLIYDFNRLAEKLIDLCNKPIADRVKVFSINTFIRALPRLLQSKDFSEIMLPINKLRKLVLPNTEFSTSQYNPFPNTSVYIVGIEDEVQVLQSLQKPRKITFKGSDGKKYIHMLKPKDDLRKDFRLMEFNDVVNLYLHREAESRQRRLCIRTYSVVPLNEECGIIEWVDNLVGLRPILLKIYSQKGLCMTSRELKSLMCNIRDPLAKKREVFEQSLLPRHPPVLSSWFRHTFPDAHCWYHARTAYVRTSAVVSMVGYILGLGDRHGENILFDATNGDTVHVDFNCLFNKGETFDWPERVPFRLTHNMVDAMGPLGVEGIFRKSCAATLRVLRTHTDTLMSIVRPFVYDPLVSWPQNLPLRSNHLDQSEAEKTNEKALDHIHNIELRLQGMIKIKNKTSSISLSCEGQANNLIVEATNIDNLCQMYIGWGPYL